MIDLSCTRCGTPWQIESESAGESVLCANCGTIIAVPRQSPFSDPQETVDLQQRSVHPVETSSCQPPTIDFSGDAHAADTTDSRSAITDCPQQFGDYELEYEIARGGMGVVYRARQVSLNRPVALKMILSAQLASDVDVQRFQAEAESAAHLDHPGIVPVYEVGEIDGQHFFSMGLVEGGSVSGLLAKNGPLAPRRAAELMQTICQAMQYAHARNIVHRDLKPANILLDADGHPKITDFGLAKNVEGGSGLTMSGQILGTPSYMPPEQAAGRMEEIGPLADVYSLGAILYCLLTGRPPFRGESILDTLMQVQERDPVSPRQHNPRVDLDLDTICLKCLRKEPDKRYASAAQLADELGRYLQGKPITARPVGRLERGRLWVRRNPIVGSLLATVIAAVVAGTTFTALFAVEEAKARHRAENEKEEKEKQRNKAQGLADSLAVQIANVKKEKANVEKEKAVAEKLATKLAKSLKREKQEKAKVRKQLVRSNFINYAFRLREAQLALANGQVFDAKMMLKSTRPETRGWEHSYLLRQTQRALWTSPKQRGRIQSVAFSPDGKLLATAATLSVKIWDAGTGKVKHSFFRGIAVAGGRSVCFRPDGKHLAICYANSIAIRDVETGKILQTLKKDEGSGRHCIAYSPNGKHLAGTDNSRRPKLIPRAKIWDATTGKVLLNLKEHKGAVSAVAYSPDGQHLATGSLDKTIKVWDVKTGKEIFTIDRHEDKVVDVVYSPDGKRLASAAYDKTVRVWDAVKGHQLFMKKGNPRLRENRVVSRGWIDTLSFGPNGKYLAGGSSDMSVTVWDLNKGREVLVLPHGNWASGGDAAVSGVAFRPDGAQLASVDRGTAVGAGQQLKVWDVRMGRNVITLHGHTEQIRRVVISPDGKYVASMEYRFRQAQEQAVRVWNANTGDGVCTIKPGWFVRYLAFSPDGEWIAGGGMTPGGSKAKAQLWVWEAATGKKLIQLEVHDPDASSQSITGVCFGPGGKQIITGSYCRAVVRKPNARPSNSFQSELHVWDVASRKKTLSKVIAPFNTLCLSPNGKRIAVNSLPIKIVDAATLEVVSTIERAHGQIEDLCFSPDGKYLLAASNEGTKFFAKVWDVVTGKEIHAIAHTRNVMGVAYSPNGRRFATAGYDGQIKIWDVQSGEEALTLKEHTDAVLAVAFHPSGTRLISGSTDKTLKMWDAGGGAK